MKRMVTFVLVVMLTATFAFAAEKELKALPKKGSADIKIMSPCTDCLNDAQNNNYTCRNNCERRKESRGWPCLNRYQDEISAADSAYDSCIRTGAPDCDRKRDSSRWDARSNRDYCLRDAEAEYNSGISDCNRNLNSDLSKCRTIPGCSGSLEQLYSK